MIDDFAFREFESPLDLGAGLEILSSTEVFCSDRISAAGYTPNHVRAFNVILGQPDAAKHFADLLNGARLAGQLYALCGLFLTDRPTFDSQIDRYRVSTEEIQTIRGCMVSTGVVGDIVIGKEPWREGIRDGGWPSVFRQAADRQR